VTISVECPKGDCRWKSVYKTDCGNFDILMLDHSHKLMNGSIKKMPTNITYCIKSLGFSQFVRSNDLNEIRDFMAQLAYHNLF